MKNLSFILILFSFILIGCDDDGGKTPSNICDPAATDACDTGQVCIGYGASDPTCINSCDPALADQCETDELCAPDGSGNYACMLSCDATGAESCGEGFGCMQFGTGGICRPSCDVNANDCEDGLVCIPTDDGTSTGVCGDQCDPEDYNICGDGLVCELRTDDLYACYKPVFIEGMVFDSADSTPIENANVMAADKVGASASNVSITDHLGNYSIAVPVTRNPDGSLYEGVFTLRASAADYETFPHGIRPSIPIDASLASGGVDAWHVNNGATDIALIKLPADKTGFGYISGQVIVDASSVVTPAGVLVVVSSTDASEESLLGFSDRDGYFKIFNVPAGNWTITGYKAWLQLDPVDITMDSSDSTGLELVQNDKMTGTVNGSVNIVNPGDGVMTTVVLVPESTYSDTFGKGEVPIGLRAPTPPEAPSITGAFTIEGVPDGKYVVLAAFENDFFVRDPDPNISGTQTLHITVPQDSTYLINIVDSFKVTGALRIFSPGATEPEAVEEPVTFKFADDSSEDNYSVVVYSAFGDEVWRDDNVARVTGDSTVSVDYGGPALMPGMYYQFRAYSIKSGAPISATEDLLGVFYIAPTVN